MSGGVKFIFKTLISIPVIVTIAYLVLNIYGYAVSYYRLTALSYSVMQIVAENNYIPDDELNALGEYINTLDTAILTDIAIVIAEEGTSNDAISTSLITIDPITNTPTVNGADNERVQYGNVKRAGVTAQFNWMNPFKFGTDSDVKVAGYKPNGGNTAGVSYGIGDAEVDYEDNNMTIVYNVVGLRYYPDLAD